MKVLSRVAIAVLTSLSFVSINAAEISASECIVTVSPTYGAAIEVDDSHYHLLEGDTPVDAGWLLPVAFEPGTVKATTENGFLWLWEEKNGRIYVQENLEVTSETEATGILFPERGLYKAEITNGDEQREVDFAIGPTGINFSPGCADPKAITKEINEVTSMIKDMDEVRGALDGLVVEIEKLTTPRTEKKEATPFEIPPLPPEAASEPSQVHVPASANSPAASAPAAGSNGGGSSAHANNASHGGSPLPSAPVGNSPAGSPATISDPGSSGTGSSGTGSNPSVPALSPADEGTSESEQNPDEQPASEETAVAAPAPTNSISAVEPLGGQKMIFVSGALSGVGILALMVGVMMFLNTWRRKKLAEQPLE